MNLKLTNDWYDNKLDEYKDKFEELKNRMSELRKNGKDTTIAETKFIDVIPLFRMAKAAYEKDELANIEKLYQEIKKELDLTEKGTDFSNTRYYLELAFELAREGNFERAKEFYILIMELYKKLDQEEKRYFYEACKNVYLRITNKQRIL